MSGDRQSRDQLKYDNQLKYDGSLSAFPVRTSLSQFSGGEGAGCIQWGSLHAEPCIGVRRVRL